MGKHSHGVLCERQRVAPVFTPAHFFFAISQDEVIACNPQQLRVGVLGCPGGNRLEFEGVSLVLVAFPVVTHVAI